jgi:hypothetical protein
MRKALPLLALLVTAFLTVVSTEPRDAFHVGVMRRDGALVPLAAFDGKRWRAEWPPPARDLSVPIKLTDIPKGWWETTPPGTDWQLWTSAGPSAVHLTQPTWVDAHCARQVALQTDYKSPEPLPSPKEQPYPKDGLAVWPPHAVEPIQIATPSLDTIPSADLRTQFNEAEREIDRNFGHPLARRVREPIDPVIEAFYAFGDAPRAYYIESSRLYRTLGDDGCTAIGFGTGWFVKEGEKIRWLDMAVDLLDCNKYGASYMLPLGAIRSGERTFWIVQYAGWDHERYVVVEVKSKRVEAVVNTWAGGC